jgi:hypothetical protein
MVERSKPDGEADHMSGLRRVIDVVHLQRETDWDLKDGAWPATCLRCLIRWHTN